MAILVKEQTQASLGSVAAGYLKVFHDSADGLYKFKNSSGIITVLGGVSLPVWTEYTVTHTQLQAAATTNNIELFSLAAKTKLVSIIVKHSVNFGNGGISITAYTVTVGLSGEVNRFLKKFDVWQTAGDTITDTAEGGEVIDHGSATSIVIGATSTGANLSASTQGSVTLWVQTELLP